MSTRGVHGFAVDGETKVQYNHSDSYPTWLGIRTLEFAFYLGDVEVLEKAREKARALVAVDQDANPSAEQIAELRQRGIIPQNVSTGEDWYAVLRDTQGDYQRMLDAGYYTDGNAFAKDPVFCEWGYVIDLDREVVEVYESGSFSEHEKTEDGRWPEHQTLLRVIPFGEIPSPATDREALVDLCSKLEDTE